jgi:hypothetical protein
MLRLKEDGSSFDLASPALFRKSTLTAKFGAATNASTMGIKPPHAE